MSKRTKSAESTTRTAAVIVAKPCGHDTEVEYFGRLAQLRDRLVAHVRGSDFAQMIKSANGGAKRLLYSRGAKEHFEQVFGGAYANDYHLIAEHVLVSRAQELAVQEAKESAVLVVADTSQSDTRQGQLATAIA